MPHHTAASPQMTEATAYRAATKNAAKAPQPARPKDCHNRKKNQDPQERQNAKKNAKAVLRPSCLNKDWGCTWKSPTNNIDGSQEASIGALIYMPLQHERERGNGALSQGVKGIELLVIF